MSFELSRSGLMNPMLFFRSSSSSSFNWCDDRLVIFLLCVNGRVLFLVRLLSIFRCVVIVFCRYLFMFHSRALFKIIASFIETSVVASQHAWFCYFNVRAGHHDAFHFNNFAVRKQGNTCIPGCNKTAAFFPTLYCWVLCNFDSWPIDH